MILPRHYIDAANEVATAHGYTLADLKPGNRNASLQRARFEVWSAVRALGASYPELAALTGHSSYTTVRMALKPRRERAA